jgi:hypothetical protein
MTGDDDFLHNRHAPAPPAGLAERIIMASRQQQNLSFLQELSFLLVIPRPAVALMLALLLSIILGLGMEQVTGYDIETLAAEESVSTTDVLFYFDEGWI